jgi:hypothetical protein
MQSSGPSSFERVMARYLKLACARHLYSLIIWQSCKKHFQDGSDAFDSLTWGAYCDFAHSSTGMFN